MIFQKSVPTPIIKEEEHVDIPAYKEDNVDTVVGPSVNVEGDFSSAGNIVVKGSVSGSVHTSKHLLVEEGANILANVQAGSATVSGTIKGNVKVEDTLILTSTAKILGDIRADVLQIEAGAILNGKVSMKNLEDQNEKELKTISRPVMRKRREKENEFEGQHI